MVQCADSQSKNCIREFTSDAGHYFDVFKTYIHKYGRRNTDMRPLHLCISVTRAESLIKTFLLQLYIIIQHIARRFPEKRVIRASG